MNTMLMLMLPILLPIVFGILILVAPIFKHNRKVLITTVVVGMTLTVISLFMLFINGDHPGYTLFMLTDTLPISFHPDETGRFFALVVTVVWVAASVFSFSYLPEDETERRFHGFYLISLGILYALDFSSNLITFYMFYELMTILTFPLVIHNMNHESIMAGLKYLLYSFCGAYLVLFGVYFVHYNLDIAFVLGGSANVAALGEQASFMLGIAFVMILGFGVKAGMFPMHGWLPTAHPVAPAPASAVLSAIIVKMGVLGIVRTVFYIFGANFLKGTWVQTVWMSLALFTVFMGSMLAYREKMLKKRLAYSTVSQVSYILFGLSVMCSEAVTGAYLHVLAHGFIKSTLFLSAGVMIFMTKKTHVDEFRGIGKKMPITLWCYSIASLGLIGIPPTNGFLSKWYLCIGSLNANLGFLSWFGPVVLLISALLTAGYLLPISIHGFLPGKDYVSEGKIKEPLQVVVPLILLTTLVVLTGMFPTYIVRMIETAISGLHL